MLFIFAYDHAIDSFRLIQLLYTGTAYLFYYFLFYFVILYFLYYGISLRFLIFFFFYYHYAIFYCYYAAQLFYPYKYFTDNIWHLHSLSTDRCFKVR